MEQMYYAGLDIHKKTISFCIKTADGTIVTEGTLVAHRQAVSEWARKAPRPWQAALEATMFSGWVYDVLTPQAQEVLVAHPLMLRALVAAKKKNDQADAAMLADLLRIRMIPECYMAPTEIRDLRRVLRYRNLLVHESVRLRNRVAGVLMETGVEYEKTKLHRKGYYNALVDNLEDVSEEVVDLLRFIREPIEMFQRMQGFLLKDLRCNLLLSQRVEYLMTIPGVGLVTALTWALEVGDPHRFTKVKRAVSYCGLCSAQKESAGKSVRGPLSKIRNAHLQTVLIEVAKLAPRHNPLLAEVYDRERQRGANHNRATLAVARKLVAWLLAIDKEQRPFEMNRAA